MTVDKKLLQSFDGKLCVVSIQCVHMFTSVVLADSHETHDYQVCLSKLANII